MSSHTPETATQGALYGAMGPCVHITLRWCGLPRTESAVLFRLAITCWYGVQYGGKPRILSAIIHQKGIGLERLRTELGYHAQRVLLAMGDRVATTCATQVSTLTTFIGSSKWGK